MPLMTFYIIVPFVHDRDGKLLSISAEETASKSSAIYRATSLVGHSYGGDAIVGAAVLSRTGESETGEFEPAIIHSRHGETPSDLRNVFG
ncbi:hypothetical protein LMIY3S_01668 [Labrys miyagiensis]